MDRKVNGLMSVCECVCEREREREDESYTPSLSLSPRVVNGLIHIFVCAYVYICVLVLETVKTYRFLC